MLEGKSQQKKKIEARSNGFQRRKRTFCTKDGSRRPGEKGYQRRSLGKESLKEEMGGGSQAKKMPEALEGEKARKWGKISHGKGRVLFCRLEAKIRGREISSEENSSEGAGE